MSDELIPGARVPARLISGTDEAEYVDRLLAILEAARLNLYFPDVRRLRSHLTAMHPRVHRGLYPGLQVDIRSGLPTYREWTRVLTDTTLAPKLLGDLENLSPKLEIRERQLEKRAYYTNLLSTEPAPLGAMDVQLRRVDPKTKTAHFHVVLDKLDASGLFVRHSIDLGQRASVWSKPVVTLDEEAAAHTEEFQSLIYTLASFDAEVTLMKLVALGGLSVERVVKGTVGPLFFPALHPPPAQIVAELPALGDPTHRREAFLATFSLSMAAIDVAEDVDEDPFAGLLARNAFAETTPAGKNARARLGFHTHRTRKLVIPPMLSAEVDRFTAARGKRGIVYTLDVPRDP